MEQLERHNFLVGIARVGISLEHNSECGLQLQAFMSAIAERRFWSTKVIDSFGSAGSSFGWGNYFWFSPPAMCNELNDPYSITFSPLHRTKFYFNTTSPMSVRFSVLYMNFTTPYYIDLKLPFEVSMLGIVWPGIPSEFPTIWQRYISLGLCLPASCNLTALSHYADLFFARNVFELQRNFALEMVTVEAKQPRVSLQILRETSSQIFILLALIIISLTVLAELRSAKSPIGPAEKQMSLLKCFRLRTNFSRVFSSRPNRSEGDCSFVGAVAGLRCMVCLWITVFHVYFYSIYALTNTPLMFAKLENFALQPLLQACFHVDLFFVISGFLMVYQFLSNAADMELIRRNGIWENSKRFGKAVARRYLRLTPMLVLTIILSDILHNALNAFTPFRLGRYSSIYCKNWWHNLLYIQNLFRLDEMCSSWTWYLACEMQYFLLCLLLLYIYAKHPYVVQLLYVALMLGFVALSWLSHSRHELSFHPDSTYSTLNELYAKPWTRIIPYLAGGFGGWLLHTHGKRLQAKGTSLWRRTFWFFACCVGLATSFMTYWRQTPAPVVAAIMSLGKFVFSITAGLVIVLCSCGHGGLLRTLLNARLWRLFEKFSFGIYLLAPIVIFASYGGVPTQFSELASGIDLIGIVLLTIGVAALSLLLFELPLQRLAKQLLPKDTPEIHNSTLRPEDKAEG
ncbi:nose resistant to fluoxetine protein 6-like [Scaptodrosophila lebanonensis]|uniref:Nose resistant to fluoxetine protein 6-like n=1 Tax=Drosophila lebanonensis TaxID=7225 RepID=A0A6J2UM84_DROLE|nr:nose resistant to fluoxetine protein 6-like [Scaptodrosophila lebanonensis]